MQVQSTLCYGILSVLTWSVKCKQANFHGFQALLHMGPFFQKK